MASKNAQELIEKAEVIGISGGRTLREFIKYLCRSTTIKLKQIIQLMGNVAPDVADYDAAELGRLLASNTGATLYSINAPAITKDKKVRDTFIKHEQVTAVWDLFQKIDIAFVGIGTLKDSVFIERKILNEKDIKKLKEKGAVGEICGRFFDKKGKEPLTSFRDRVISINLEKLKKIPLVIGVTCGRGRSASVIAAAKGGIVNGLIMDHICAEEIISELRK